MMLTPVCAHRKHVSIRSGQWWAALINHHVGGYICAVFTWESYIGT